MAGHRHSRHRSRSPVRHRSPFRRPRSVSNSRSPHKWGPPSHSRERRRHSRRDDDRKPRRVKEEVKVKTEPVSPKAEPPKKEGPNFKVSGKLAEDTNIYNGIVIKYNEPQEARKPKRRWRLYPFKGDTTLPMLPIHRQSAYLLGRERKVADIPIDHPSCSKQHAVLQFRLIKYKRDDDTTGQRVRPYIIDLESANGTFVNNQKIDPRRYVELMEKDVIKFGFSTREYVMLHEESQEDDIDEVGDEEENAANEEKTEENTEENEDDDKTEKDDDDDKTEKDKDDAEKAV